MKITIRTILRFSLASALLLGTMSAKACGPCPEVHNFYIMSVCNKSDGAIYGIGREGMLEDFWADYTGDHRTEDQLRKDFPDEYYGSLISYFYDKDCKALFQAAYKKKDVEMQRYLEAIVLYSKADGNRDSWDYPTAEQVRQKKQIVGKVLQTAQSHFNGKYKEQWVYLAMRCNLAKQDYLANYQLWKSKEKQLAKGAYKELCRNIYANALLNVPANKDLAIRKQNMVEAMGIYADQQDEASMSYYVDKLRNYEGLKYIYQIDPNSSLLSILLQDIVNGMQETEDASKGEEEDSWGIIGDAYLPDITSEDASKIIPFALEVVKEGKTKNPALWLASVAMLEYIKGNYQVSFRYSNQAMNVAGTDRVHDVAHCIHLLANAQLMKWDGQSKAQLVKEMEWLDGKARFDGYFNNVMVRLIYTVLVPKLKNRGSLVELSALMGRAYESQGWEWKNIYNFTPSYPSHGGGYALEYEATSTRGGLDNLSADEMKNYYRYLSEKPKDVLQKYLQRKVFHDKFYFYDYIGTKLIAENRMAEALTYLEQLPTRYLNEAYYYTSITLRDFTYPIWMGWQYSNEDYYADETPQAPLIANQKIAFCKSILNLQAAYRLAKTEYDRKYFAYQLATQYMQACYGGCCWYLSHFVPQPLENSAPSDVSFSRIALNYINVVLSGNPDYRQQEYGLYARAFILANMDERSDPSKSEEYDPNARTEADEAYYALARFYRENNLPEGHFMSHCDVLLQYLAAWDIQSQPNPKPAFELEADADSVSEG